MEIVFRNVHIAFKDYVTVSLKYMWRRQKMRLLLFPAALILSVLLQLYIRPSEPDAYPVSNVEKVGLFTFTGLLAISIIVFVTWRGLRKRYDRTQFLQKPATYIFTEAGIKVEAPGAQGFNSWDTIESLLLMQELALLTTKNFTVHFLDFRCLESPAAEADFVALVKQHGITVK